VPLMVTGTWFPTVSIGEGVTLKLFCDNGFSLLLQDVPNSVTPIARSKEK